MTVERYATSFSSTTASASMSVRRATARSPSPDVAHETGRNGQVAWFEAGREQSLPDDARGTDLGTPQLGVGVQIAAEGNELVLVALGERRFVEQVLHGYIRAYSRR